jgi:hypothetical protein
MATTTGNPTFPICFNISSILHFLLFS